MSPGINVGISAFDNTRAAFASFTNNARTAATRVGAITAAVRANRTSMAAYTTAARDASDANRRMGVSFGQLLTLMIKFGFAMQLIQLPTKILGAFTGAVEVTKEWERELALTNTILRLNTDQTQIFSRQVANMNMQLGGTVETMKATFDAAQQLVGITLEPIREEYAGLTSQAQAVLDLTRVAQMAAEASGASIADVGNALGKVVSLLGLPTSQAENVADMLFRIQELSDLRIQDLAMDIGELLPLVDLMAQGDAQRGMKTLEESLAIVGAMSQALGPAQAFTGFRNFVTDLIGTGTEQERFARQLKELGVNFSIADAAANGLAYTFTELRKILPSGEILDRLVKANLADASAIEERNFRTQQSILIWRELFPDIRAFRGATSAATQQMEIFDEMIIKMSDHTGVMSEAYERMSVTISLAQTKASAAANAFRIAIGYELIPAVSSAMNMFTQWTDQIVNLDEFIKAPLPGKIAIYLSEFTNQFDNWFRTEGRFKVERTARSLGESFAALFSNTIGGGSSNVYFDAGVEAMMSFTAGFTKSLLGIGTQGGVAGAISGGLSSIVTRSLTVGMIARGVLGAAPAKAGFLRKAAPAGIGITGGLMGASLIPDQSLIETAISAATGLYLAKSLFGAIGKRTGTLAATATTAPYFNAAMKGGGRWINPATGKIMSGAAAAAGGAGVSRALGIGGLAMGASKLLGFMGGPLGIGLTAASIGIPLLWNWWQNRNQSSIQTPQPIGNLPANSQGGNYIQIDNLIGGVYATSSEASVDELATIITDAIEKSNGFALVNPTESLLRQGAGNQ